MFRKLVMLGLLVFLPTFLVGCPDEGSLEEGVEEIGDEVDDATDI